MPPIADVPDLRHRAPMSMLTIERRFCGPPASGNGGYVAGLLARELGGSGCEVKLLAPPPLDRPLEVRRDGAEAQLLDGEQPIASAVPADFALAVPPAPGLDDARAASAGFTGFSHHIFPGCFVCGPDRAEQDGLHIFPGRTHEDAVAALWRPALDLCDAAGIVGPEFVWAALDCPGFFAVERHSGPAVLGKLAVRINEEIRCGEPLVVTGWHIESSGRKHRAGTALHRDGRAVAVGLATWISLRQPPA